MEQFTLSSSEMVFKQNMSETIICNHVALINPEEKRINESAERDLLGYSTFSVCVNRKPQNETNTVTKSKSNEDKGMCNFETKSLHLRFGFCDRSFRNKGYR